MARNPVYSRSELDALEKLPVTIPEYQPRDRVRAGRPSQPFSSGQTIEKYTRATLLKKTKRNRERTNFFEETLYGVWGAIGRRLVPYAFREANGALRSLDAGCLGSLVNRAPSDWNLLFRDGDPAEVIVGIKPTDRLITRSKHLEQTWIASVSVPQMPSGRQRRNRIASTLTESQSLVALASPSILGDIEAAAPELATVKETTRDTLIKVRLGQGQFRTDLINYWGGCAVLGDLPTDVLLASHIKPWRACNNDDRLDPYNGLLLSPSLNHVFDKGFVSFAEDGKILLSSGLDNATASRLGLNEGLTLRKLEARHQIYLGWHRAGVFRHPIP
jgi:HNH endonuclease